MRTSQTQSSAQKVNRD